MAPSTALGYPAAFTAILFFGSSFIPAKAYDSGNGVFYQWVMCCAIFICGLCLQMAMGFPVNEGGGIGGYEAVAMLGGALWCTGNIMAVPVIQRIGMGLGLSIWGVSNMLVGYVAGLFGLMGAPKSDVKVMWMSLRRAIRDKFLHAI